MVKLRVGTWVRRTPGGRWCRVADFDAATGAVKIKDGRWVGWVTATTFARRWEVSTTPEETVS